MVTNLFIASLFIFVSLGLAINIDKAVRISMKISQLLYRFFRQVKLFVEILIHSYHQSRQIANHPTL